MEILNFKHFKKTLLNNKKYIKKEKKRKKKQKKFFDNGIKMFRNKYKEKKFVQRRNCRLENIFFLSFQCQRYSSLRKKY